MRSGCSGLHHGYHLEVRQALMVGAVLTSLEVRGVSSKPRAQSREGITAGDPAARLGDARARLRRRRSGREAAQSRPGAQLPGASRKGVLPHAQQLWGMSGEMLT